MRKVHRLLTDSFRVDVNGDEELVLFMRMFESRYLYSPLQKFCKDHPHEMIEAIQWNMSRSFDMASEEMKLEIRNLAQCEPRRYLELIEREYVIPLLKRMAG